jgi:hypothetical protein
MPRSSWGLVHGILAHQTESVNQRGYIYESQTRFMNNCEKINSK